MPPDEDADPPPQHWDEYDAPGDAPGSVLPDAPETSATPPTTDPPPSTWVPEPTPQTPFVPYGSSGGSVPGGTFVRLGGGSSGRIGSRWSLVGLVIGLGGAAVGVAAAIYASVGGGGGLGISNPLDKPDMHAQSGIDDLVSALKDQGAGTTVYDLNLYPDYAVVDVAVPGGSGFRYQGYYFDGSLDDDWGTGTDANLKTLDLTDIDGSLLAGFCDQVTRLVENPGPCYILVNPSETPGDKSLYQAYVSNDFSESASISYDADGNELSRYKS